MFHYLFPILTMGLSLFIVWLESVAFFGRTRSRFPPFRKTDEERAAYHQVAYALKGGRSQVDSFWGLRTSPWLGWQYAHNMSGAAITGAFLLAGGGAFYTRLGRHLQFARICLTVGVVGALIFTVLQIFPP